MAANGKSHSNLGDIMTTESEGMVSKQTTAEAGVLAAEVAAAYGRIVKAYTEHWKLTPDEARQRATEMVKGDDDQEIMNKPPKEVSWYELNKLSTNELTMQKWASIKQAALDDLSTGHVAARIMEDFGSNCWSRATFLALRTELMGEWRPRNGIERQLIDTMAQAQTMYFIWLEVLRCRAVLDSLTQRKLKEEGSWCAPRVTDSEAMEQAATMADRFNRMFLRTLRALRDLRRYSSQVVVQNAEQVNIGQQQVNVNGSRNNAG
jgi:hypothetical protein